MKCEFCKENYAEYIVFETRYWKVVLAENQSYLGRCFVILKRHCGDLVKLNLHEWKDMMNLIRKLEKSVGKSFGAKMFNWFRLMNNSYQNNPPNPHVHWHFRPRYNKKVKFSGIGFEDKYFGHHYERKTIKKVSIQIKNKIINKIKLNLK